MPRYQPTLDILTLTEAQRETLPIGQWVRAGTDGPLGRFYGEGRATTVVAWIGNAKGRYSSYMAAHNAYGRKVRETRL